MSLSPTEITLQEALQDFGLRTLPREWKSESNVIWVSGIARVTKVGSRTEYVKCVNNGHNIPSITRDYGACAAILSVDAIYPVDILDKSKTPDLRSDKAIIAFLSKNGYNEAAITSMLSKEDKSPEEFKADRAVVKGYITQVAITLAKKMLAEEDRVKEIRNYANRIKHGRKKADND